MSPVKGFLLSSRGGLPARVGPDHEIRAIDTVTSSDFVELQRFFVCGFPNVKPGFLFHVVG